MNSENPNAETAPKLSIVMPVYGVEDFCVETLESLWSAGRHCAQQWELIIVDDNSKDNSISLLKEEISGIPEMRHRILSHSQNKGLGMARRTGAEAARGEFVWFVDSDDLVNPEAFIILLSRLAFLKESEFLYATRVDRISGNGRPLRAIRYKGVAKVDSVETARGLLAGRVSTMMWDKVFRLEEILPHLSSSREREDAKTIASFVASGFIARSFPASLVVYRVRPGSITNSERYVDIVTRSQQDKAMEIELLKLAYGEQIKYEIREYWARNRITDSMAVLSKAPDQWRTVRNSYSWADLRLQISNRGSARLLLIAMIFRLIPAPMAGIISARAKRK